ncbi:hypothetical protein ACFYQT_11750 [Streptomyces tibetensis]|uniref:Uncharacterized protein n=1 Tax=Streptomyces tibetensis TaxID=2382123 RepID=A0ABW6MST6_9ACTN
MGGPLVMTEQLHKIADLADRDGPGCTSCRTA